MPHQVAPTPTETKAESGQGRLRRVVREVLSDRVLFEQRPERTKEISQENTWGSFSPGTGDAKGKGPAGITNPMGKGNCKVPGVTGEARRRGRGAVTRPGHVGLGGQGVSPHGACS